MSAQQDVERFTIELERGEPIHGRLLDADGEAHPFHGGLELSAALEQAWRRGGEGEMELPGAAAEGGQ